MTFPLLALCWNADTAHKFTIPGHIHLTVCKQFENKKMWYVCHETTNHQSSHWSACTCSSYRQPYVNIIWMEANGNFQSESFKSLVLPGRAFNPRLLLFETRTPLRNRRECYSNIGLLTIVISQISNFQEV